MIALTILIIFNQLFPVWSVFSMFIFSSFLNRFQCIQKFLKKLCFCENCYVSTSSNISRILSRPCSFLRNSPGPNRDTGVRYNSNLNPISRSSCRSPAPVVRFCPQKLLQWLSAASVLQLWHHCTLLVAVFGEALIKSEQGKGNCILK